MVGGTVSKGRPPLFDRETARLRRAEQERRRIRARDHAFTVLSRVYPEEFKALQRIYLNEICANAEPLPGDEQLQSQPERNKPMA